MYKPTKNKEVVYPELSYKIVGILFEVCRNLGSNHREKYYQEAVKNELIKNKIKFKEQLYLPLDYKGNKIGKYFLDFLVEDKIILELKKGSIFHRQNIDQVLSYLKTSNLKLGIIANFTREGVKFYRVLNIK
jgi:GxxExxY protein